MEFGGVKEKKLAPVFFYDIIITYFIQKIVGDRYVS